MKVRGCWVRGKDTAPPALPLPPLPQDDDDMLMIHLISGER